MKVIRQKQAEAIRDIALEAVREALEDEGLNIMHKGMIWSGGGMDLTFTFVLPEHVKQHAQEKVNEAREFLPKFGLPPDSFAREFYMNLRARGEVRVKIVNIKPRNHKYPIIVEVFDHSSRLHGKRFKCGPNQVKKALGVK